MRLRSLKAERGFEAGKKTNNNNSYNNGSVTSVGLRFYFMYLFFLFSVFFFGFLACKRPRAAPIKLWAGALHSRRQVAVDDLFVLIPILSVVVVAVVSSVCWAVSNCWCNQFKNSNSSAVKSWLRSSRTVGVNRRPGIIIATTTTTKWTINLNRLRTHTHTLTGTYAHPRMRQSCLTLSSPSCWLQVAKLQQPFNSFWSGSRCWCCCCCTRSRNIRTHLFTFFFSFFAWVWVCVRTCHCLCLCMCVLKVTVSRCSFGFSLPVQRISNMAAKICVAFNCTTRRTLTSAQAPCPALCMHAHAWNEQRVVNTLAQILFRIMSRQMPPCTRCEMNHSICKIYILLLFLFCL